MSRQSPRSKAASIDLSRIGAAPTEKPRFTSATAPGQALQNSFLRIELEQWQGASPVRHLDATKVHRSKWANRHEASYRDADFESLKAEIDDAGGNVQPIKVRPIPGSDGEFEVIFGHRRHQSCLELGFPVLAMIADVSDQQVFVEMDRENRNRKDLRPYEQGLMYSKALEAGLYPSLRKMAETIGIDQSLVSKAVRLARLPDCVLNAFLTPLEIQFRWIDPLVAAVDQRPDEVKGIALALKSEGVVFSSKEVFEKLITDPRSQNVQTVAHKVPLTGSNGQKGTFKVNPSKRTIDVCLQNIPPDRTSELENLIRSFLGHSN